MNTALVAEALRQLANALETPAATLQPAPAQSTEPATKRGRGRPVRAEEAPIAAPAPANEADPFAPTAVTAPVAPAATLDEVRTALKALQAATTQENALNVLKSAGGVDNLSSLSPAKYGDVELSARMRMPQAKPVVEADPFETAAPVTPVAPVAAVKPLTIEEVKAAVVAAQKKAGTELAQKIVMEHGGKAPKDGGGYGPSLKALPPENFAACVAALGNVPTTK